MVSVVIQANASVDFYAVNEMGVSDHVSVYVQDLPDWKAQLDGAISVLAVS